jgi:hypothetical protein
MAEEKAYKGPDRRKMSKEDRESFAAHIDKYKVIVRRCQEELEKEKPKPEKKKGFFDL